MAEKLTESNWTAFTKKLKLELDDGALIKALAKADKTDIAKPEPRFDALEDLVELIKKQVIALAKRKKELGDKVFGEVKDKLYALLEVAEEQLKLAETAMAAAKAEASGDEEEDTPVLLTKKMIPLVRELRKGGVTMHALICTAGKNTALLIMRRPIAPARRKLLAEAVDAKGGAKYIAAECMLEDKVLTFVVQSQAAGLAKRLRQALLDQTELRLKVKVRGDDGEDEDGSEEGSDQEVPSDEPDIPPAPPLPPVDGPDPALAFKARLEALMPKLKSAHPSAEAARLKAGEAGAMSRKREWDAATRLLDEAEALLAEPDSSEPPAPSTKPTIAPAIVYTQTRLAWGATRKKIQGELQKLEKAILDAYKDHTVLPEVAKGVRKLDQVLEVFDESLNDALDAALNSADPEVKKRHHDQARDIIARYQGFLKSDAMVQELDANPFVPIAVQSTLSSTLAVLASKIG
ncbi:MAG: hypothetical protein IV097_05415 [Burkholderiaceae bacterium]|nr:hypothetical protein [Burkholderiaceae bacterium]